MLTEAIAAARAGDRARARDLLARLLRSDSANAEYWVWMSTVVESEQERIYCLESALRLDPTNRAALRGMVILGARTAEAREAPAPIRVPRRQVAAVVARPKISRPFNWRLLIGSVAGLVFIVVAGFIGTRLIRSGGFAFAPALQPASPTPTDTPVFSTATPTPIPAATRVLRTAIPTELARTPLIFFVDTTPTPTPITGATPHPEIEAYQGGLSALIQGDYEEALRLMDQVIEIDDHLADAHYFRGEALRALDEPGRAFQAYDRATAVDLQYAPAFLGRGRARLLIDANADPTGDYLTAIHIDPNLIEAYLAASDYYASKRLWLAMDTMLQQAIDSGVTEPILYIRLSQAQYNRNLFQESLDSAIEGSGNDPTIVEGYLAVGRAYLALHMDSAALWPLQTYTAYQPSDPQGWAILARAYLALGDTTLGLEAAERALALNDRSSAAYLARGYIRASSGDNLGALQDFERAQQYGTQSFDLFYGYAKAYFNLGQYAPAHSNLGPALANAVDDWQKGEAYALRALAFESTAPPARDDAIANWSWLLELPGASPETRTMAEQHLDALLGGGPTRTPRPSLTPTSPVTPASPTSTLTATPTPAPTPSGTQASPTAGPSPTATILPTAEPTETPWVYR